MMYLMIQEYRPEALGDYKPGVAAVEAQKAASRQARTDESYIAAAIAAPNLAWVVNEEQKNAILREGGVRSIELTEDQYRKIVPRDETRSEMIARLRFAGAI